LLAYITYFIVTVIIRFVRREANLAAAGTLSPRIACRLSARYTRRIFIFISMIVVMESQML